MTRLLVPLARCPAAGSIRQALNRAARVVCIEFSLDGDHQFTGVDCSALRGEWKEWTFEASNRVKGNERTIRRIRSTMKSCDRLFDAPCSSCDKVLTQKAREEWQLSVSSVPSHDVVSPRRWADNPIEALKRSVRELLGLHWASRENGKERMYVPDQQGCFENERLTGGTLGVSPVEFSLEPNIVRVGVAKTKGKFRVVTMQSARTKEILVPIHDALYDHISSFGWCVRGDVTKSDFETVAGDVLDGERFISGDYKSATNNIFLEAVEAIIDVLCESEHLTAVERETLRSSFTNLSWVSRSGRRYPIRRGSMMGNLVSFPVLCLLNKACFDIACDMRARSGGERKRKGRFNGDDCVFCGDTDFFLLWREITSTFGLVVNEEKTGRSRRFLELNSRSYDFSRHRFVAKPVLSFLRKSESSSDLLSEVVKGASTLSRNAFWYILNVLRWEISVRPISLASVPDWLWRALKRKRWMRKSYELGPLPIREVGTRREIPITVGPCPPHWVYPVVDWCNEELKGRLVTFFRGKKVAPYERNIDRRYSPARRSEWILPPSSLGMYERTEPRWAFSWPTPLLSFIKRRCPGILLDGKDEWIDDHPSLTTKRFLTRTSWRPGTLEYRSVPPPTCLLLGVDCLPLSV